MSFPDLVAELTARGEPLPERIIIVSGKMSPTDRMLQAASLARLSQQGCQVEVLDDCGDLHAELFEIGERREYKIVAPERADRLLERVADMPVKVIGAIRAEQQERRDELARQRGSFRQQNRAQTTKLRQYKVKR